ncbi:NAD(P)-binding protein [Streptomyces himastatinicus]|uniref:NAD(P)-binding protein n=1 Tax=Streptomyces himastatinicus TaxID=998084 RepID=UPI0001B4DCD1|nr:FAD/NAD(P)-binding oxidoreductase [Streptomyces himastatinicus]
MVTSGDADLVGMTRAMLTLACSVNPEVAHPELAEAPPPVDLAGAGRTVVVGAGPAGIEVARVLAENGLDVVVLEQDDSVGGRIDYALLADPHQVCRYRRWAERSLSEHGVEVRLGTRATPSALAGLTPERVVFAGGSSPTMPRWLESARYEVRTDADYLAGAWEPTHDGNVVVYDPEGYSAGSAIALRPARDTDRKVTLVTPLGSAGLFLRHVVRTPPNWTRGARCSAADTDPRTRSSSYR